MAGITKEEIARIINKLLPLTPEEIRRLKQYASDENYRLYILARDTIVATIQRAKRANELATIAYNNAQKALSIIEDLQGRTRALSRAVASLQDQVSSATAKIDYINKRLLTVEDKAKELSYTLSSLETKIKQISSSIDDAWAQINAIVNHLKKVAITAWDETIGKNILAFAQKIEKARERIESIWRNAYDKITATNNKVMSENKKILDALEIFKSRIVDLANTIGWAQVDYSKLDGRSNYDDAGNKGRGIIRNVANTFWCLGQFYWNMTKLIEKRHIGFNVLGTEIGFDIYEPRPDHLATAISWLYIMIRDPVSALISNAKNLNDKLNKVMEPLQWISSSIVKLLGYTRDYIDTVYGAIHETMNVLLEMFSGKPKVKPQIPAISTIPAVSFGPTTKPVIKQPGTLTVTTPKGDMLKIVIGSDGKVSEIVKLNPDGTVKEKIRIGKISPY